jgi:RNA polymerase sigma factor (sigma-70 family)
VKAVSARGVGSRQGGGWDQRYGRLYEDLKRPARAMVRRAFGSAFGESEIEDIYGNAWLATLRALEKRQGDLSDGELRKYVLTAVANHASKELRRRGRRPTAPLEAAPEVADADEPPDERAATKEQSQLTRDVLGTLPPRRRAVLLFRYGWGLKPEEVCGLIKGLSPRAYRKEITRGVNEVSAKLRLVEQGRWCGDREPVLKAYAAGTATTKQKREAEQHLAHCRHCTEYVATLSGQLRDLGSAIAWTGALEAFGRGDGSIVDRATDLFDRAREAAFGLVHRGDALDAAGNQLAVTGGTRGAGGAAVLKLVAVCAGTAGAGAAGVTAGLIPAADVTAHGLDRRPTAERTAAELPEVPTYLPTGGTPSRPETPPGDATEPHTGGGGGEQPAPVEPGPPAPASTESSPAPTQQEFAPAAGAPVPGPTSSGGSAGGSGGASAAAQEFGP